MTFYISTAIDYVNAKPHMGHIYEKILADTIARWYRLKGEDVFFLTGTDENGQKIVKAAELAKKDVQEFVDEVSQQFVRLCKTFNISYDSFLRTTGKKHIELAQKLFQKMYEKGDIYKGEYEGLYCYGCESFLMKKDLENGKCPIHKKEPELIKEPCYFFKLSKYENEIKKYFEKNKRFVLPLKRRSEMVNRLKEGLNDISVSRYNLDWGIPIPFDKKHRIYVWFEADMCYVSGLEPKNMKYWPANYHLIGNEINWFHSIIWPAILLSAGYELPKSVIVHGMILNEGQKMSKSLGNVVDPFDLAKKYPIDAIRYFFLKEIPFGEDGSFSEKKLKNRLNGELLSDLGNLVSRVLTLAERFKGKIEGKDELSKHVDFEKIDKHIENLELHHALEEIWSFIRHVNKYINDKRPWRDSIKDEELSNILYNLIESLRVISIFIYPFMPETSGKICKQLGVKLGTFKDLKFDKVNYKPKKGEHLFKKCE